MTSVNNGYFGRNLMATSVRAVVASMALAAMLAGCGDNKREGRPTVDPRDTVPLPKVHPVLQNTIGEQTAVVDTVPIPVSGFGVVADLPNTGAPDFRPDLKEKMRDMLYRKRVGSVVWGTQDISPERILSSRQVALVEVHGSIPPMAQPGTPFDIDISAVTDTQTTSLEHGVLWPTDLTTLAINAMSDGSATPLAEGFGQLYCPPQVGPATQPSGRNIRTARIPNGGVVQKAMPARLQLYNPSIRMTMLIARAVNTRFPTASSLDKVADPTDDRLIPLHLPAEYKHHPQEFVDLVRHMYIGQDVPGFTEKKADELLTALADPKAPHRDICLCLQALGRTIINDKLRACYTSPNTTVRFYSAWAGAGLQDVQAMPILESFALDTRDEARQLETIEAIVKVCRYGETYRASSILAKLVDGTNEKVRLAAYEGLVAIGSPVVRTYRIARKFDVDVVASHGAPLIFASQTGRPRIAIIGQNIALPTGVLYVSRDNLLTVNVLDGDAPAPTAEKPAPEPVTRVLMTNAADADAKAAPAPAPKAAEPKQKQPVQLYYRGLMGNQQITMYSGTNLMDILTTLAYVPDPRDENYSKNRPFIGISYQRAVEMLAQMCGDESLNAKFVIQPLPPRKPTAQELIESSRSEKPTDDKPAATQPAKK